MLACMKRCVMIFATTHIFCGAAELHPDATLARLRELLQANVLVQAALDDSAAFARVRWRTYYFGEMIVRGLTRGFLRQGDMQAMAQIQHLPLRWQMVPVEMLSELFTSPECGKALLAQIEAVLEKEKQQRGGVFWDHSIARDRVIERLAAISPADAVRWIETRPELLSEHKENFSLVLRVHAAWQRIAPKSAEAWIERVRREHPPKQPAPAIPVIKDPAAGPLLPVR